MGTKTADAQLGMASQQGRGAGQNLTTLMACILAVAYPELAGCLRESQQPQGMKDPTPTAKKVKDPTRPAMKGKEPAPPAKKGKKPSTPAHKAKEHAQFAMMGKKPSTPARKGKDPTPHAMEGKKPSTPAEAVRPVVCMVCVCVVCVCVSLSFSSLPPLCASRLYSPSSSLSTLVFQLEHDVDEHRKDLQFRFHGGVVLPCVSDGEYLLFCDAFPRGF
ncbi:hypothetical protein NDU88_002584 [Pleurodeles waltl]|uniref:Uncharacterized protein n=1 Tax=Pleurodeles waltl TaxID=8319 RepID=A0AAV7Q9T6_PLEWA|nr:hypothetical protein NDU88_002584 [Pleurodeles waltl]